MGYKKDVIKGVSWSGSLSMSTKAIGFLEIIILARILVPEQFGAYAVALLALGLLEVLTETGVNIVLLQEKNIEKLISSAWVVSIIRGIIISAVLFLSSDYIAAFFHSPESAILLKFISIAPILRGFINPSVIKFQKELQFKKDFWLKFSILTIDTVVSIVITYITKNPIGIVIGLLSGVFFEMFVSHLIIKPRPSLRFEKNYLLKIFHRGKWITASSIFDYLFHNADNIIVGRLLGANALGVYQLAYAIAVIPLSELGKVFLQVILPVFLKIGNDIHRLRYAYKKIFIAVLGLSLPIVLIFVFFSDIFVLVLGSKWSEITEVIPILAVVGFLFALYNISSSLFLSVKMQKYGTITNFVNISVLLILIFPLIYQWGIVGASVAVLVGVCFSVPLVIYYTLKLLKYI